MSIGQRVKEAREARGLGVNELDRKLGKAQGYTSRLERSDRAPRGDTLEILSDALGVSVAWLLSQTDVGGPAPTNAEDMPIGLRDVLDHDPPRGRQGVWLPVTVEQLSSSWSYGGVDRSHEDWIRLGDDYDYVNRRHGLAKSAVRTGAPLADLLADEVEAKRAEARAQRSKR
jgi:transcriptional regulator with XRE-family HTH domain